MKKSHFYISVYILFPLMCLLSGWLYFLYTATVSQDGGVVYYLKPNTSETTMIAEMAQQGIIQHPLLFSLYVNSHFMAHLKTGEYRFRKGATPSTIWRQVTTGTGLEQHPFTIIPGWSFMQLRKALTQADGLKHMTTTMTDKQIMALLGHAELAAEGEFFPETYYYTRGMVDVVILKRAHELMQNRLNEAWSARSRDLPYKSEYEALIVASLIEKEAFLDGERPVISGVVVNRLRKNMLLQIDPTVIYGMGNRYNGKIHKSDLRENTAYNTYVHTGLPPTPIDMPGMTSIEAAMHPEQHNYLYYVSKGDGSHQFSKTLEEHNSAVKSYIKHDTQSLLKTNMNKNLLHKPTAMTANNLRVKAE